jgi:hypothetical protein
MKYIGSKRVERNYQIIVTVLLVLLTVMFYIPNFAMVRTDGWIIRDQDVNLGVFFSLNSDTRAAIVFVDVIFGIAALAGAVSIWMHRPIVTAVSTVPGLVIYFLTLFAKYNRSENDYWIHNSRVAGGGTVRLRAWIGEWYVSYYIGWICLIALIAFVLYIIFKQKNALSSEEQRGDSV